MAMTTGVDSAIISYCISQSGVITPSPFDHQIISKAVKKLEKLELVSVGDCSVLEVFRWYQAGVPSKELLNLLKTELNNIKERIQKGGLNE